MKKFLLMLCAVLLFAAGCSSGDEGSDIGVQFKITPQEMLDISSEGGEYVFTVTSNGGWTINDLPSWCTLTQNNGNGNATVTLNVSPNSEQSRSETLKISLSDGKSATLKISQLAVGEPKLVLSKSTDISGAGEEITLNIETDLDWEILSYPSWCKLNNQNPFGRGSETRSFVVEENPENGPRSGEIKFSGGGYEKTLVITQNKDESIIAAWESEEPAASIGEYLNLNITAIGDWTLEDIPEWCTPSIRKGSGNQQVGFAVGSNWDGDKREHTIKVKTANSSLEVKISQYGGKQALRFIVERDDPGTLYAFLENRDPIKVQFTKEGQIWKGCVDYSFSVPALVLGVGGTQSQPGILLGRYTGDIVKLEFKSSGGFGVALRKNAVGKFLVNTIGEMKEIIVGGNISGNYLQESNLDFKGVTSWAPIEGFIGTYDGGNHEISNLTINPSGSSYTGLFGHINNVTLENIKIVSGTIRGSTYVGSIAGSMSNSTIRNCVNRAQIVPLSTEPSNIGGIAGSINNTSKIIGCQNYGAVNGDRHIGGIVGWNIGGEIVGCTNHGKLVAKSDAGGIVGDSDSGGSVKDCVNKGAISGFNYSGTDWIGVGGIIGKTTENTISYCRNEGAITAGGFGGTSGPYDYIGVGGIVGNTTKTTISCCMNEGAIKVGDFGYSVGGIVGVSQLQSIVEKCKNTGSIAATGTVGINGAAGGIVGVSKNAQVVSSYNRGSITGTAQYCGGIIGYLGSNASYPIVSCYSVADKIEGTHKGALIGETLESYLNSSPCFWSGSPNVGVGSGYDGTRQFGSGFYGWPTNSQTGWETPGTWKSLGGFTAGAGGTPLYPVLSWE